MKKDIKKRLLALLLSFMMILPSVPIMAIPIESDMYIFNPVDDVIRLTFDLEYTQLIDIDIYYAYGCSYTPLECFPLFCLIHGILLLECIKHIFHTLLLSQESPPVPFPFMFIFRYFAH
mgnify:CR=1 FL=1